MRSRLAVYINAIGKITDRLNRGEPYEDLLTDLDYSIGLSAEPAERTYDNTEAEDTDASADEDERLYNRSVL